MWNYSFTACSFVIKERYKDNEYRKDLYGEFSETVAPYQKYKGALDVFGAYCTNNQGLLNNEDEKRLFKVNFVSRGTNDKQNFMLIKIESGRYGFKSTITDKDTQKVSYHQKETDAPLMGFYLMLLIPKPVENTEVVKGFMFFQNYGHYGVKTETIRGMRNYFSNSFNLSLWVGNIAPEIFVEKMLKSESIKRIQFIRNNPSRDAADNLKFTYGREQRVIEKVRLSESFISKLHGYLAGSNRIFEFEEKNYDDVKVTIDVGNRERTIGLNNIERVSIIETLPDTIKGIDGEIDTQQLVDIFCAQAGEYMKRVICHSEKGLL